MDEIEHNLEVEAEKGSQEDPIDQGIGVSLDEDEIDHEEFCSESDSEAEQKTTGKKPAEEEVDDDEWITSDNFDQKLQDGLGMGGLRL